MPCFNPPPNHSVAHPQRIVCVRKKIVRAASSDFGKPIKMSTKHNPWCVYAPARLFNPCMERKNPLISIVSIHETRFLLILYVDITHVYVLQKFDGYIKAKGKQTFTDFFLNGSSKAIFECTHWKRVRECHDLRQISKAISNLFFFFVLRLLAAHKLTNTHTSTNTIEIKSLLFYWIFHFCCGTKVFPFLAASYFFILLLIVIIIVDIYFYEWNIFGCESFRLYATVACVSARSFQFLTLVVRHGF